MITSLSLDPRYDSLITSLHQIDALLQIAASIDTTEFKPQTLNNFFWIGCELVHKTQLICDDLAHVKIFSLKTTKGKNDDQI
jgi:hypothetical protein